MESGKESFETGSAAAAISGDRAAAIEMTLKIVAPETSVEVSSAARFANSDANYRALRTNSIGSAFVAENVTLKRDLGEFTFKSGTIAFTRQVGGREFVAVSNT